MPKPTVDAQEKIAEADILLSMGMRVGIVRIQTALPERKISARARLLRSENVQQQVHRGRFKSAKSVIEKHSTHMEAVSFLLLYLRYSAEPQIRIDNTSFLKAFLHYCAALEVDPTCSEKVPLEINRCWVIARDYREGMISLIDCSKCEGGKLIRYQSNMNRKCPVCGHDGQPEEFRKKDLAQQRRMANKRNGSLNG